MERTRNARVKLVTFSYLDLESAHSVMGSTHGLYKENI